MSLAIAVTAAAGVFSVLFSWYYQPFFDAGQQHPFVPVLFDLRGVANQHGYTLWTSYQPVSRFWPFQWIEGGWLLALSVLLIAATVWLVRRRAA